MKILILSQWFDPEPTFKGLLFARELATRGHNVEVLTGFPNYPGGKVYPRYRIRLWQREQMEGIPVLRVPLYPSHDKSAVGRALNYISFAISAALIGSVLIRKPDIVYVYHPPATIGFAAVVIRFLRGAPFVYDIQDLWPDSVAASGMVSSGVVVSALDRFCKWLYRRANHLVVLSPGFRERLVHRGVPASRIDVIYNWCDEFAMEPGAESELASTPGLTDRFNVMFAGTMGTAQALDSVIDAAAICLRSAPGVQFVFVGEGVERSRLEKKVASLGLPNIRFLQRQPVSAMGSVLALADVLLVHLRDAPLFRITIPSKTQAYMAAGKPILMAVPGDAAQLVTQSGGGLVCEPENPRSIAETVVLFAALPREELRRMGEAGRRFYKESLSLARGVGKFETLFKKICHERASVRYTSKLSCYSRIGKRVFDLAVALPLLILLSPVMALIWFFATLFLGKPAFFRQVRPGRRQEPFTIYKFRTMREAVDPQGIPLPDGERLHPFGSFLRRTSLDELPELWNVLRGDMSLVGPRPLLMKYLPFYTDEERIRFTVRPGITGWAQVHGRNEVSWDDRLRGDIWYVKNQDFLLDLKILSKTVVKVARREHVIVDARSMMLNLDEERSGMERIVSQRDGRS